MKKIDVKLDQKWDVQSSGLKEQIQEVPQPKLLWLEDEDEDFKDEFNRVIDNKHLKDVNTTLEDVNATLEDVKATLSNVYATNIT